MADVDATLPDWSITAASNKPTDATSVGSGVDDNMQTIQAVVRAYLAHYNAAAIASGATTDLGANTGLFQEVSGANAITSLGNVSAGIWKVVVFQGALTLTHNAVSLILPGGANITTAAGDCMLAYSKGAGNWRVPFYQLATGYPLVERLQISDSSFRVFDNADSTRKMAFEVSAVAAGTTRTVTIPNANVDLTLVRAASDTVTGVIEIAIQSELETPSSNTLAVPPGRIKFHPGVAKAFVQFNNAGAIAASHNVASVTDNGGVGNWTVNFTTAFASTSYAVIATGQRNDNNFICASVGNVKGVGGVQIICRDQDGNLLDGDSVMVVCFGDQA